MFLETSQPACNAISDSRHRPVEPLEVDSRGAPHIRRGSSSRIATALGTPTLAQSCGGFLPGAGASRGAGAARCQAASVAAPSTEGGDVACTAQIAKVEKAQAALDRVTAVFAKQNEHAAKAKKNLDKAETRAEKKAAKAKLAKVKETKEKVAKEKKAQQQRLAKATERRDECLAARPQPPTAE